MLGRATGELRLPWRRAKRSEVSTKKGASPPFFSTVSCPALAKFRRKFNRAVECLYSEQATSSSIGQPCQTLARPDPPDSKDTQLLTATRKISHRPSRPAGSEPRRVSRQSPSALALPPITQHPMMKLRLFQLMLLSLLALSLCGRDRSNKRKL